MPIAADGIRTCPPDCQYQERLSIPGLRSFWPQSRAVKTESSNGVVVRCGAEWRDCRDDVFAVPCTLRPFSSDVEKPHFKPAPLTPSSLKSKSLLLSYPLYIHSSLYLLLFFFNSTRPSQWAPSLILRMELSSSPRNP